MFFLFGLKLNWFQYSWMFFRNAQEDALLLQPRRRRLMSTAAYENSDIKVFYDNNEGIVPVENHNPTRRAR